MEEFQKSTVADSTTEAEYIAASEAAKEACWMKKFMIELGFVPDAIGPVILGRLLLIIYVLT